MLCDAKPHWVFTPACLQVYARLLDPWHNLWWLFEYRPASTTPSEGPDELPQWKPDPSLPPSYVHRTIDAALQNLRPAPESFDVVASRV